LAAGARAGTIRGHNITGGYLVRALTISAHGGLERLEYRTDLPEPETLGPHDVRVRIAAAALNHLDLFVVEGLPGVTIRPPWVLGTDGAGTVDRVGTAVTAVRPGDRVIINAGVSDGTCEYCLDGEQPLCPNFAVLGEHRPGMLAELIVLPAANVRRIPDSVPFDVAAAFTLATLTAWRMIVTRARVRPDDQVLIWGIGGGVALAALQIVKHIGATAWVTSGSDDKLARARELGADHTINYRGVDVGRAIRAATGKRGVDVVVDSVGRDTWAQSLGALGRRGRLVTCGGTSGPIVETDVRRLFWNQWSILGSTMGNDAEFDEVAAQLTMGRLLPPIDSTFDLADGRRAFERLASGAQFGKIVVRVS